jgi:hypothetical protein
MPAWMRNAKADHFKATLKTSSSQSAHPSFGQAGFVANTLAIRTGQSVQLFSPNA